MPTKQEAMKLKRLLSSEQPQFKGGREFPISFEETLRFTPTLDIDTIKVEEAGLRTSMQEAVETEARRLGVSVDEVVVNMAAIVFRRSMDRRNIDREKLIPMMVRYPVHLRTIIDETIFRGTDKIGKDLFPIYGYLLSVKDDFNFYVADPAFAKHQMFYKKALMSIFKAIGKDKGKWVRESFRHQSIEYCNSIYKQETGGYELLEVNTLQDEFIGAGVYFVGYCETFYHIDKNGNYRIMQFEFGQLVKYIQGKFFLPSTNMYLENDVDYIKALGLHPYTFDVYVPGKISIVDFNHIEFLFATIVAITALRLYEANAEVELVVVDRGSSAQSSKKTVDGEVLENTYKGKITILDASFVRTIKHREKVWVKPHKKMVAYGKGRTLRKEVLIKSFQRSYLRVAGKEKQ